MAAPKTLSRDPKAVARRQERKLHVELRAFERMRPSLLRTHRGLFVAVHHGAVLDSDADEWALAARIEGIARHEGAIAVCMVCEPKEPEPFPCLDYPPLEEGVG
jgi:hypothetical protein